MKGKKKASAAAYDSEEPTEQEMSVGNMIVPWVSFYQHDCTVSKGYHKFCVSCCFDLHNQKIELMPSG